MYGEIFMQIEIKMEDILQKYYGWWRFLCLFMLKAEYRQNSSDTLWLAYFFIFSYLSIVGGLFDMQNLNA